MILPRLGTVSMEVSAKCFLLFVFFKKSCTFCLKEAVRDAVCFCFNGGCDSCSLFLFSAPPPRGYHDRDLATGNSKDIILATFRGGIGYLLASAVLLVLRGPLKPKP